MQDKERVEMSINNAPKNIEIGSGEEKWEIDFYWKKIWILLGCKQTLFGGIEKEGRDAQIDFKGWK